MKRRASIIFAAILAILLLVACTQDKTEEKSKANGEKISVVQKDGEQMPELVPVDGEEKVPEEAVIEIPRAVRVEGVLYFDTGKTSDMLRCGVMDGEIIYSVPKGDIPTQDNESNFGVGYGYQWGFDQDTIVVCMEDKWCIFAVNAQDFVENNRIEVTQNSVKLINDGMLPCKISNEEAQTISDMLAKAEWTDVQPKCLFDVQFNLEGHIYDYSTSCGSFKKVIISGTPPMGSTQHDVVYGYTHVTEEQKNTVNGIIKNYIRIVDEAKIKEKPKGE